MSTLDEKADRLKMHSSKIRAQEDMPRSPTLLEHARFTSVVSKNKSGVHPAFQQ